MADDEEVWTGEVEEWQTWEGEENVDPAELYDPSLHYVNPKAFSRWPLNHFVAAAHDGDLELLAKMLDRDNPIDGYHGDINVHCPTMNALHSAAVNGQLEAVEMLLGAGADPHVKTTMPYGKDPQDGETARDLADKWGWDEVADVLKRAEEQTPKGTYRTYGTGNNAKLWPIDKPMGLDPVQERRAVKKYKGLVRAVPNRAERKFYGDAVYGITHGYDEQGKPIRGRREVGTQEAARAEADAAEPWVAAPLETVVPHGAASVGLLFPGQGSQYVRMMEEVKLKPGVQRMLTIAKEVLDFDVLEVCLSGPESTLDKPEVLLPAMFVACLAGVEKLRETRQDVVERPGSLAGLFIGEYTALTMAGVWSFKTGLTLMKAYGEAIAEAVAGAQHASISVAGLEKGKLAELCEQVRSKVGKGAICQINMELFPKGFSCGGTTQAVEMLKTLAEQNGALQCKLLRTFGAIHTPLMEPVRVKMEAKLTEALPSMRPPRCDVYLNSTGKAIRKGAQPKELVGPLSAQASSPVLWEKCVSGMITMGIDEFYEVGPSKQLKAMMKRIDPSIWGRTKNVEV